MDGLEHDNDPPLDVELRRDGRAALPLLLGRVDAELPELVGSRGVRPVVREEDRVGVSGGPRRSVGSSTILTSTPIIWGLSPSTSSPGQSCPRPLDPVAYVLPSASSRTMCIPPAPGALSTPAKTWRNCGVPGSSSRSVGLLPSLASRWNHSASMASKEASRV